MGENKIKQRYDRIAPIYDKLEALMEKTKLGAWRKKFWQDIKEEIGDQEVKLLEAGVGTGKNLFYYPEEVDAYAIDFSEQMLKEASKKEAKLNTGVNLLEMDIQNLEFADDSFDLIVTSCVFCSVPDPVQGLKELRRVCKPEGKIFLLEHMRTNFEPAGRLMDLFNWISLLLWGANINRQTIANIKKAGLKIISEEQLLFDIVKKLVLKS